MGENHLEIYPGASEIFFFCNFEYVYGKTSWKYTENHLQSSKIYIFSREKQANRVYFEGIFLYMESRYLPY